MNEYSPDQENESFMEKNQLEDNSKSNNILMDATKKSLPNLEGKKLTQHLTTKQILSKNMNEVSPINKLVKFTINQQYDILLLG